MTEDTQITLEDFAKQCGVTLSRCKKEFGGTWAYSESDSPNLTFCGFTTKGKALLGWFDEQFSGEVGKAIRPLLADKIAFPTNNET